MVSGPSEWCAPASRYRLTAPEPRSSIRMVDPYSGHAASGLVGIDHEGSGQRVLERGYARLENHLLLPYGVVFVVVRPVTVGARLA